MRFAAALMSALLAAPAVMHGQVDFRLGGRSIQMHGFASQGFVYSNQNNFLTMKTSEGSGAFTDGGLNVSTMLTERLRVGVQAYARNVGEMGNGRVELDWAYGDYRFTDWLGVRAGKVKTAFGLFNDTQDAEFLHTWAMLPQSVYPLDLRSNIIAHTGVDVYGEISLKKAGSLSYTGYVGQRPADDRGGYAYSSADAGVPFDSFSGRAAGADLRWNTPVEGLMIGSSWMDRTVSVRGTYSIYGGAPYQAKTDPQHTTAAYVDYTRGRLRLNGEFRHDNYFMHVTVLGRPGRFNWSDKGWFAAGAFRVSKRLEVGTYHSRYYVAEPHTTEPAANHIYDQTVTARIDLNSHWNVKVEGHFMDGYGDTYSAHGFYTRNNRGGLKPTTTMLVLRTGWNF